MELNIKIFQSISTPLLIITSLFFMACTSSNVILQPLPTLESPLPPPFQDPILLDNRWELVSLVVDGTAVDYNSIQPLYIRFYTESLQYNSSQCGGGGFYVTPMPNQTFVVGEGSSTLEDCGQVRNKEIGLLSKSIRRLTSYELNENEVLLTGDNIIVTLVLDTPWATP